MLKNKGKKGQIIVFDRDIAPSCPAVYCNYATEY